MGNAGTYAHCAMGHPRILARSETCLSGLARRILAGKPGTPGCEGLGEKLEIVCPGLGDNEEAGGESKERSFRPNSARHGTNHSSRSSSHRRSQCVSPRPGCFYSQASRRVEVRLESSFPHL